MTPISTSNRFPPLRATQPPRTTRPAGTVRCSVHPTSERTRMWLGDAIRSSIVHLDIRHPHLQTSTNRNSSVKKLRTLPAAYARHEDVRAWHRHPERRVEWEMMGVRLRSARQRTRDLDQILLCIGATTLEARLCPRRRELGWARACAGPMQEYNCWRED